MHTYTHNDKEPIYHSCCSGLLSRCSLKETPGLEKLMTLNFTYNLALSFLKKHASCLIGPPNCCSSSVIEAHLQCNYFSNGARPNAKMSSFFLPLLKKKINFNIG